MKALALLLFTFTAIAAMGQSNAPPYLFLDGSGNPFPAGSGTPSQTKAPPATCVTNVSGSLQYCNFSGGSTTKPGSTLLFTGSVTAGTVLNVVTRNATGQSGAIFQSDFTSYQCSVPNFYNVAVAGGVPIIQFSTNGGSSYDTSSDYGWAQNWMLSNGTTGDARQGTVSAGIPLFGNTGFTVGPLTAGGTNIPLSIVFNIDNPAVATAVGVEGSGIAGSSAGGTQIITMGGYENTSVARNAFRIVPEQGSSFTFSMNLSCYGLN